MKIGIPKEIKPHETRVALTPVEVAALAGQGHELWVQRCAGELAGFHDADYLSAGARLAESLAGLYQEAELIVKVKEPQASEFPLLTPQHQLFCYLHLGGDAALTQALQVTGVTAYGFECLLKNGATPLLAPMSRIAGRLAVQMGAWYLQATQGGRGSLLGGFASHPGVVTVIGAGVAGQAALELAVGMGAQVNLLDINPQRLIPVRQRFPQIKVHEVSPEVWPRLLPETDLLIGAAYVPGRTAPKAVNADDLRRLPQGAVAVDISVDQGGCLAPTRPTSHGEPMFEWEGILLCAVPNLPAAVPRAASTALAQAIAPYVAELAQGSPSPELAAALNLAGGSLKIKLK